MLKTHRNHMNIRCIYYCLCQKYRRVMLPVALEVISGTWRIQDL